MNKLKTKLILSITTLGFILTGCVDEPWKGFQDKPKPAIISVEDKELMPISGEDGKPLLDVNMEATNIVRKSLEDRFKQEEWYKDIKVVLLKNNEAKTVVLATDLKDTVEDKKKALKIASAVSLTKSNYFKEIEIYGVGNKVLIQTKVSS